MTDRQDAVLDDGPLPSREEMKDYIQAVNEIGEAISEAIEALSLAFIPSVKSVSLAVLRMALGIRLGVMWNNPFWLRVSWCIARRIPAIFLAKLLPVRFLSAGLIGGGTDD